MRIRLTNCLELIAVNQANNALTLLYDVIVSKRSRTTPLPSLEPIVEKFVELCVQLRKGKLAKDALVHYKNIAQNTSVATIEVRFPLPTTFACLRYSSKSSACTNSPKHVIKHYIHHAEQHVTHAQSKANAIALDQIEDLEAIETPESILLSTVSTDGQKDRTDREVVTPWLKFLWESYRTALDILRNNARLEILYQMVANHAFSFCLKYQRKTEFRRLCELLRSHVSTAQRYSHQANMVNLADPDTLQRHIDTRFVQLNAATDLELWNEAFKSIEDVQLLLSMSKKTPRPFMMANYYEKLAKIFLVADNFLFHSAAINKYYQTLRLNKNMSEEEHERMANAVLVGILAIPIVSPRLEVDKSRNARLTNLLRSARAPTREGLLKEALAKNLLGKTSAKVKDLYKLLEVEFHPLNIGKQISPILESLSGNAELSKYVEPLHQVILTRVLQQLSQVYATIKIEFILSALPFEFDLPRIEKFIMNGCKRGELSIRIDHATETMHFISDAFGNVKTSGPSYLDLPSEQMRLQLVNLAKRISTIVDLVSPPEPVKIVRDMEKEREKVLDRIRLIERKKEKRELDAQRMDEAKQLEFMQRKKQEAEAERLRIAADEQRRESDRIANQRLEIERMEAKKLAEKMAESLNLKMENLEALDTQKLMELQATTLEAEKRDFHQKMKTMSKRFDHLERAFRSEEKQLLVQDYQDQKKKDYETYLSLQKSAEEAAKLEWTENVTLKKTLGAILDDYSRLRSELDASYSKSREAATQQAMEQLAKEKEKKRTELQLRKAGERMRRAVDEENRKEREVEEQLRKEEEARLVAERLRRENEREQEYEDRKRYVFGKKFNEFRKLDEQAQKQAERERLAEEKIRGGGGGGVAWKEAEQPWKREEKKEEVGTWRRAEPERNDSRFGDSKPGRQQSDSRFGDSKFGRQESDSRFGDSKFGRQDSGRQESEGGWRREGEPTRFGNRPDSRFGDRLQKPSSQQDQPISPSGGGSPSDKPQPGKYVPPVRRQETGDWRK
jgi:translation initiation factor 3 subunit A